MFFCRLYFKFKTQHNIDYEIKVSQIDLLYCILYSVFTMNPTLNYTVTKAAQSIQLVSVRTLLRTVDYRYVL